MSTQNRMRDLDVEVDMMSFGAIAKIMFRYGPEDEECKRLQYRITVNRRLMEITRWDPNQVKGWEVLLSPHMVNNPLATTEAEEAMYTVMSVMLSPPEKRLFHIASELAKMHHNGASEEYARIGIVRRLSEMFDDN